MVADLALFLRRQHPIADEGIGTLAEQRHTPRLTEPLPDRGAERSGAREAIGYEVIVERDIKRDHAAYLTAEKLCGLRRQNSTVTPTEGMRGNIVSNGRKT